MAEAAELLRDDHGLAVEVEDRTILLTEAVKGDVGHAVLRVVGLAQEASPVAAAARGPAGVAAATWTSPSLYLARWTKGTRWVVGYRLTGGAKPHDYVRTEGRIPTRLETGSWYGDVPEAVSEAFFDAGLLLDDPPFPPPPPPAVERVPPAPASAPEPARRQRAAAAKRQAPPRAPRPRAVPVDHPPKPGTEGLRLCPTCRMHKGPAQFIAASDLCVDCRP